MPTSLRSGRGGSRCSTSPGVAHFRYLDLAVGPGVFIPRPETESVVQLVIDWLKGDGCTAWRIPRSWTWAPAPERSRVPSPTRSPAPEVHAVEFSEFAHAWAATNLAPLGVKLVRGDLRDALREPTERSTSSSPIRRTFPRKRSRTNPKWPCTIRPRRFTAGERTGWSFRRRQQRPLPGCWFPAATS